MKRVILGSLLSCMLVGQSSEMQAQGVELAKTVGSYVAGNIATTVIDYFCFSRLPDLRSAGLGISSVGGLLAVCFCKNRLLKAFALGSFISSAGLFCLKPNW